MTKNGLSAHFGETERMSIECHIVDVVNSEGCPQALAFGRICLWVKHQKMGDDTTVVLLNTAALMFQGRIDCSTREDKRLNTKTDKEIWEFLNTVLFEEQESALFAEVVENYHKFSNFCIFPGPSEAFDGETAFLIEEETVERFIWQDQLTKKISSETLPRGTFRQLILSFLRWFETRVAK